jgi:hypothetical protein
MLSDFTMRAVGASVINRASTARSTSTRPRWPRWRKRSSTSLQQQLNDPAPDRCRALHKVMDNVPDILAKANYNNTATDSRMLANAPSLPGAPASAPKADRVGALTQIDGWDSQVTSLLGTDTCSTASTQRSST